VKINFHAALFIAWITIALLFSGASFAATPDVFRSWFTPTVVPTNFVGNVRFEAEITGGPSSVVFNYSGTNRLMYDDGSHGDLTAGDNVWTCLFTTDEIISKNTASRVFRPFIGTCNPTNAGAFNAVAEFGLRRSDSRPFLMSCPPTRKPIMSSTTSRPRRS